jgi:general secretion pathway protein H
MLVTLVIMALLAGLATVSAGGNAQRGARDEMARIRELLAFARDEAPMQGEELGFIVDDEIAYRVLRFDPEAMTWTEITEKPLERHALPAGLSLELSLPDAPNRARSRSDDAELQPDVLVSSSGEISGFRLDIRLADSNDPVASLGSDGSGTLQDL